MMILINSNYLGFASFKKMNDKFLDKKCIVGKKLFKTVHEFLLFKKKFSKYVYHIKRR